MTAPDAERRHALGARTHRRAGVSHIEVLVAMLIVGLATPFLLGGITGSLTQTGRSYERGAATAWAQGQIEALRRGCFEDLHVSERTITQATTAPGEPPLPPGLGAGVVRIEDAGPALRKVSVAVFRRHSTAAPSRERPLLEATTLIADLRVAGVCP